MCDVISGSCGTLRNLRLQVHGFRKLAPLTTMGRFIIKVVRCACAQIEKIVSCANFGLLGYVGPYGICVREVLDLGK